MCRALRGMQTSTQEIEIAVALTEGLVSGFFFLFKTGFFLFISCHLGFV
jgi:hypothetical protein